MAKIERIGYGQVEPNHLSAQRTAQIYAQLPCEDSIEVLETLKIAILQKKSMYFMLFL